MRTIAIVPALNEARSVGTVVRALAPYADEVIVVDDGSMDGTAAAALSSGATVVSHVINRGQGAALRTGTVAALARGADVIVHVDADGQHDPTQLPSLLVPINDDRADIVFGSRFMGVKAEGMPFSRRLLLAAARIFSTLVLGIPRTFTDPQSGLRAMTAAAARELDFRQDRMAHCSEILRLASRSRFRTMEVPVRVIYTGATLAKGQKAADALKIVWQLVLGSFHR
jgi:glycosyltransferase involved in cell wall biosynthesis